MAFYSYSEKYTKNQSVVHFSDWSEYEYNALVKPGNEATCKYCCTVKNGLLLQHNNVSLLRHVSKIVSILLSKLSDCPNTDTSLCYCNPFITVCMGLCMMSMTYTAAGWSYSCICGTCIYRIVRIISPWAIFLTSALNRGVGL